MNNVLSTAPNGDEPVADPVWEPHELDGPEKQRGWIGVFALAAVVLLLGVGATLISDRNDSDVVTDPASTAVGAEPDAPRGLADEFERATPGPSAATGGTPPPDFDSPIPADDGAPPLPLGTINELPNQDRLDFLFEFCFDECFRDAHFMDPENPQSGSGPWPANRPFHIRHGFPNDGDEPLGPGFDVAVYAYPMNEPSEFGGAVQDATLHFSSDYVLRGESESCGPTYKDQTGPVTCEWFVHDFPEGLPFGRWAIWAVWEAPCAAWVDYGLVERCENPDEVMSHFSSGVDSPFDDGGAPFYGEMNMAALNEAELDELFAQQMEEMETMEEMEEQAMEDEVGFETPPPGPEVP